MRYLLTGGSACGKSGYAEALAMACPTPRIYVATMQPYGAEGQKRIERHREMRAKKQFSTVERYTNLAGLTLPERGVVLLECIGNLTANEMFNPAKSCDMCADEEWGPPPGYPDSIDAYAAKAVLDGVERLAEQCETLIVVTNEVGSDGGGYEKETMRYVDTIGYINARLAERFDRVYELVCGIPLPRKGELP